MSWRRSGSFSRTSRRAERLGQTGSVTAPPRAGTSGGGRAPTLRRLSRPELCLPARQSGELRDGCSELDARRRSAVSAGVESLGSPRGGPSAPLPIRWRQWRRLPINQRSWETQPGQESRPQASEHDDLYGCQQRNLRLSSPFPSGSSGATGDRLLRPPSSPAMGEAATGRGAKVGQPAGLPLGRRRSFPSRRREG